MKTWSVLYLLIWVAFVQILMGVIPALYFLVTYGVHPIIGVVVLVLAFLAYRQVRSTACPDRIKRITKTTFILAVLQGALGVLLYVFLYTSLANGLVVETIDFLHVVNALAIITQASSSATAFDMWEEKEFAPAQPPQQGP
ncbi:MAG TPA: hypothetical protein VEC02_04540 [Nitrososphaerales archaeon]|nr:hypothetical protein [Nitrososphaerales archaeon]